MNFWLDRAERLEGPRNPECRATFLSFSRPTNSVLAQIQTYKPCAPPSKLHAFLKMRVAQSPRHDAAAFLLVDKQQTKPWGGRLATYPCTWIWNHHAFHKASNTTNCTWLQWTTMALDTACVDAHQAFCFPSLDAFFLILLFQCSECICFVSLVPTLFLCIDPIT